MKKSTLLWIGGGMALFFVVILVLMYLTLQPSPEFASVENAFEEYMFPGHMKKRISLQLGPVSLYLLRKTIETTSFFGEYEYDPSFILRNINKGEFGIYEVDRSQIADNDDISAKLTTKMNREGWRRFFMIRDNSSNVEGFFRQDEKAEGLFIYILDGEDLVILNIGANSR